MTYPKLFDRAENSIRQELSDVHQGLGDTKIREICDRYSLEDEGKDLVNQILLDFELNDLVENKELTLGIIGQEIDGCPEKETIIKIINDIAQLFIFTKQQILAVPERRLVCQYLGFQVS